MALVELLDLAVLGPDERAVAEQAKERYGMVLNTWRALFHRPEIFAAYYPFLRSVAGPGALEPVIKDLSALLVGALNGCRYTVSHRSAAALANGATPDEIAQVVGHDWTALPARTALALELTRVLTVAPQRIPWKDAPGLIEAEMAGRLQQTLSDAELVELTFSISVWNALSRFHRVMGFELDMPAPPQGADPALFTEGALP